jgi:hypothetical protein
MFWAWINLGSFGGDSIFSNHPVNTGKASATPFGFAAWTNLLPLLSNFSFPTSQFRRRFVPKAFG